MCTDQIEVKLNVYDLHPYNKYGYWLGLGVFHAGVEFLGKEWTFGYCNNGGTGVYSMQPRVVQGAVFRESITIGFCPYMRSQINSILTRFEREFPGSSYNIFTNNCATFCDKLCFALTQQHIPSWVTRLGVLVSQLSCAFSKSISTPLCDNGGDDQQGLLAPPPPPPPSLEAGAQEMRSYGYYHCHNSSRHGNEIDDDGDYISDSNCNNESESVDDACKDGTVGTESSSSQPCVFQEDFKIYSYIPFIVGKNKNY